MKNQRFFTRKFVPVAQSLQALMKGMVISMEKINVGIIGCGNISSIYMENINNLFMNVNLYAICDLVEERATEAAEKYKVNHILSYDDMLNNKEVQIILNLTTPKSHYKICKDALLAGKHVYVEKPIALNLEEGKELVTLANSKNLLLGGAPDTFMGAGIQTCIKAIHDGLIGEIISANAFMMCHGHESWHPDPEFYYQAGGGPMFDMGPYYLTALVAMIGPVSEVVGMNRISFQERTITSSKKFGNLIKVEVPTHVAGLLKFHNGAIGNIITSFDTWGSTLPRIEVHGTRGSLIVPDPNCFDGEVLLKQHFSSEFEKLPLTSIYSMNSRGAGVSDMANCILHGRKDNRANGELACHVLNIMVALHESQEKKEFIALETTCEKPKLLDSSIIKGMI